MNSGIQPYSSSLSVIGKKNEAPQEEPSVERRVSPFVIAIAGMNAACMIIWGLYLIHLTQDFDDTKLAFKVGTIGLFCSMVATFGSLPTDLWFLVIPHVFFLIWILFMDDDQLPYEILRLPAIGLAVGYFGFVFVANVLKTAKVIGDYAHCEVKRRFGPVVSAVDDDEDDEENKANNNHNNNESTMPEVNNLASLVVGINILAIIFWAGMLLKGIGDFDNNMGPFTFALVGFFASMVALFGAQWGKKIALVPQITSSFIYIFVLVEQGGEYKTLLDLRGIQSFEIIIVTVLVCHILLLLEGNRREESAYDRIQEEGGDGVELAVIANKD